SRVQGEPVQQVEAGLASFRLEAIARHDAEPHGVAARTQSENQPDDGIGAAGPPAVGRQVDDRQAILAHARAGTVASAYTAAWTRPASIEVMQGCSIGQVR